MGAIQSHLHSGTRSRRTGNGGGILSTELAQITEPRSKVSAMAIMASRLQVEPDKLLATLKNTVWKGASNEELVALTVVANEYRLNPLLKELYAFPAKGGGIVPIVSIDGWLRIINEHPQMNGIEANPIMEGDKLIAYVCKIHRKDRDHPTEVTEYLSECKRNTDPWKMEHRMLRHKAVMQCARIAFGFSGIHDEDDAQVIRERKVTGREVRTEPLDPFKPAAIPEGAEEWNEEGGDQ
jgi:hypothetical protein